MGFQRLRSGHCQVHAETGPAARDFHKMKAGPGLCPDRPERQISLAVPFVEVDRGGSLHLISDGNHQRAGFSFVAGGIVGYCGQRLGTVRH